MSGDPLIRYSDPLVIAIKNMVTVRIVTTSFDCNESRPGPWRLVSHVAGLPSRPWRRIIVYLASVKRRPVSSGRFGEDGVHQADFQLKVEQTNE